MIADVFRKIANEAPSMLWVADAGRKYIFFNKAWLQFRGSNIQQELAFTEKDRIFSQDVSRVEKKLDKSFAAQRPYKIEYRLKIHDGSYRWILENGNPNFNDEEEFIGFIGSCMDIHDSKELEKKKDEFVTAASHEFKTPLTSLNIYIHLMREYFKTEGLDKYKEFSDGAALQVQKMATLVERLLDLNKIQSNTFNITRAALPFSALVHEIVRKINLLYPERKIHYLNGSDGAAVYGDSEKLGLVVENLLLNAIKYSRNAEKVLIESAVDNGSLVLDVTDYGIGIAKEYQTKIFDRFFRIPGVQQDTYPGMGMGLYVARKIIEKHNGTINVESHENKHTKFSVKLPLLDRHGKDTSS